MAAAGESAPSAARVPLPTWQLWRVADELDLKLDRIEGPGGMLVWPLVAADRPYRIVQVRRGTDV